jgi:hypothetical protein
MFVLTKNEKYSIHDIEAIMPFEKEIYMSLLVDYYKTKAQG